MNRRRIYCSVGLLCGISSIALVAAGISTEILLMSGLGGILCGLFVGFTLNARWFGIRKEENPSSNMSDTAQSQNSAEEFQTTIFTVASPIEPEASGSDKADGTIHQDESFRQPPHEQGHPSDNATFPIDPGTAGPMRHSSSINTPVEMVHQASHGSPSMLTAVISESTMHANSSPSQEQPNVQVTSNNEHDEPTPPFRLLHNEPQSCSGSSHLHS